MTFSLLFDLDDTLLTTNLDAFLGAYFKKLAGHMANDVPPDQFVTALMRSTQIMYKSVQVNKTLEQVFWENFYPELGHDQKSLAEKIDKFYDEVFPTLGFLTAQRQDAINLVEWAFSQGWNVAIATDPLFPRKAILHRLRWAGLAPEKYPFTLISDFQTFHFAKASVSYYPEFLFRLGWTDGPILMVGDSLERDVIPAQQAGLPVFWLNPDHQNSDVMVPQGQFKDLRNFLETTSLDTLKVDYSSPKALPMYLRATPAVFHTLLETNSPGQWVKRPRADEWSMLEVLCHLRDVDLEVNLPRLRAILNEDNSIIEGLSTDEWAVERKYFQQDTASAFRDFVSARMELIQILSSLDKPDWERRVMHTFFGPTNLRELVEIMVDHDRLHTRQATTALK